MDSSDNLKYCLCVSLFSVDDIRCKEIYKNILEKNIEIEQMPKCN